MGHLGGSYFKRLQIENIECVCVRVVPPTPLEKLVLLYFWFLNH